MVSGALIENNLIMVDIETRTTWPQILAMGNSGVREGECLDYRRNNAAMTWEFWRRLHPETLVLGNQNNDRTAIEPEWYFTNPYREYHEGRILPPHPFTNPDDRLPWQKIVVGVHAKNGKAAVLIREPVAAAKIGESQVVFFHHPESGAVYVFENNLGGKKRVFEPYEADQNGLPRFRDLDNGTLWSLEGLALEGPDAGMRMAQLPALHLYWFAWSAFFPDTPILKL